MKATLYTLVSVTVKIQAGSPIRPEGSSPSLAKTLQTQIIDPKSTDVGGVFDVIQRPDASIGLCLNN